MARNADVLRELIALFNRGESVDVARYFTPDFELDDPAFGVGRSGHEGALAMWHAMAAVGENVQLEILHVVEDDDYLAVRYHAHWQGQQPGVAAMIAMYRFVDGRIAEDWGVSTRAAWRR